LELEGGFELELGFELVVEPDDVVFAVAPTQPIWASSAVKLRTSTTREKGLQVETSAAILRRVQPRRRQVRCVDFITESVWRITS
jgi:hypothetical protein